MLNTGPHSCIWGGASNYLAPALRPSLLLTNSFAIAVGSQRSRRSWCTCITARWFSLSWLILLRRYVLSRRRAEKLRSASALLHGTVISSRTSCSTSLNIVRIAGSRLRSLPDTTLTDDMSHCCCLAMASCTIRRSGSISSYPASTSWHVAAELVS